MSPRISYESALAYDKMPRSEIDRLEVQLLRNLLSHARDTVPFYAAAFDRARFHPLDFERMDQLHVLPLLDKGIILRSPEQFRSTAFGDSAIRVVQTGGSTGEPFRVLTEREDPAIQCAFNWAQWHRLGIRPGDPTVALSGMAHKDSPNATFVEHRAKDVMLRVHRPSMDASPPWQEIIKQIREFRPVMIRGFPSIVVELAQAMTELGEKALPSVLGVSLSSEDILPGQRQIIERAFGVHCFGFYGQSEHCVLAMECGRPDVYHIYPGYAHIEIVDEDGTPITTPGQRGEVIGTSLLNYAMPLIRYRTGDLAEWGAGECSCGRHHRMLTRLAGRKRCRVAFPDGRTVHFGSDIYDELWYAPEKFRQIQFEQTRLDELNIRVVPFLETNQLRLRAYIESCLRIKLGDQLKYRIEFVPAVERTSSGKYLLFLQKYLH